MSTPAMEIEWRRARAAKPVPLPSIAASSKVFSGRCALVGWALYEPAGVAASFDFFDGQDATGTLVGGVSMAANGSSVGGLPDGGVLCEQGLYLARVAGTIRGAIFIQVLRD